ncbi:AAA family ATPase [Halalkalibacter kiskunsagensis]|uniref:AAA family ATPase n=1 Tax=Halalkalibacter kiskunsagensis TaxID=1548599 RepID=A0ABV6KC32_9BACI
MRFDYLQLLAFGHFTNYQLLFEENKNFHLIYGPNEAGKSTILRSVSNFLYGFPRQTTDSFLHSNKNLRIEGQLKDTKGETLQFIRRKGTKNTVLDMNNNAMDEKKVHGFLNGMSEQHFLNMFALDHVRLREGGESLLQSDGNVGESLFSAASGISVLKNVLEELDKKSRSLYLKGGSKPEINQALKEEREISTTLAENQLKIQTWRELERTYIDGKEEIETLLKEMKTIGSVESKYLRLQQTLPKMALRNDFIKKLDELSNIPDLPEQAEEIRKENLQKVEAARKAQKKAEDQLKEIKDKIDGISVPEGLLDQTAVIEALYREAEGYRKDVKQLPILDGKQKQLEQSIRSSLKEIDVSNQDLANVDQYRVSAEKKKMVRELSEQKPLLDHHLKTETSEFVSIQKELKKLTSKLEKIGELPDIDTLEHVMDKIKSEGKVEEILKETRARVEQLEVDINESIRLLPLWEGTSEELLHLKIPNLTETVKKYQKQIQDVTYELKQITDKIESENELIEENEKRIRELESLADIPTEEVLNESRNRRDSGWLIIRNKLNTGDFDDEKLKEFTNGLPVDMAFEKSVHETDGIADKMRREAEKLGEKNKFRADIETSKKKLRTLTDERKKLNDERKQWEEDWTNEWKAAKIKPLTPDEMIEWLERYELIIAFIHDHQRTATEVQILEVKRADLKTSLEEVLLTMEVIFKESSLEELMLEADKTRKQRTVLINERNHLIAKLNDLHEKLEKSQDKQEETSQQINEWKIAWEKALDGLALSKETTPTVVKELLETYDACVCSFDDLMQIEEDIKAIKVRISNFEEKVRGLNQSLVSELVENEMDVAVNKIYQSLQKASQDQVTMETLQMQLKQGQDDKKEAANELVEANAKLAELIAKANCQTFEELEKVEAACKQKVEYADKIEQLNEQLIEIGNGRTIAELIDEAEHADKDVIDFELAELRRKRTELDQKRSEMEQAHGVVKKEYNEKIEGTNFSSVQAAEEKQSVLAKITHYTDEYMNHKLASLLLKKGIEFYREKNQSPIMNRASEIFQRLTLQSFDGITVEFDEKDQPVIMGIRNTDERIPVSGMSDGTTDQLYLALRIASIEKYVNENEPIPFIVDDILVHFDDERSKETLKVLVELSKKTQIIFFTHHYRLIELMKEVTLEPMYQLKDIQSATQEVH